MKKILFILSLSVLCLFFTACNNDTPYEDSPQSYNQLVQNIELENEQYYKYISYAFAAQDQDNNSALLFQVLSEAKKIILDNQYYYAEKMAITNPPDEFSPKESLDLETNLKNAIVLENLDITVIYPKAIEVAAGEKNKTLEDLFARNIKAEQSHKDLLEARLKNPDNAPDVSYHLCKKCGYIAENSAPFFCPVCGSFTTNFQKYE